MSATAAKKTRSQRATGKGRIKTKHTHRWQTTHSYGAWGHEAMCVDCGVKTTFVTRD